MNRRIAFAILWCLFINPHIDTWVWSAGDRSAAAATVDFARDVYPILQRACFECHGARKQEGGLRLDLRSEALDSGVIDLAQPATSELLRRISLPRGHEQIMPAIGEPLPKRHVAKIRQWIEQGAVWPENFEVPPHWSYVVPQRPTVPLEFASDWIQSPIDYFVWQRLHEEGLSPSPSAEPAKLVRRLFLDLIGIPPTPIEVEAFEAEPTQAHYVKLVDELLSRPQFGERWARPWLDLARYADSHGFQRDDLRDNWAYRDWVIQALNTDMPFDQFTIEQLAGDLLPNATESQKIATGFHRNAPTNVEAGSLPEETRVEQVLDRVNTTGAIWLGTTLECCQCHDHKYDPFTIKEYYSLFAFYNSTELEADLAKAKIPSSIEFQGPSLKIANPERDRLRSEQQQKLAAVNEQLTKRKQQLDAEFDSWVAQVSGQAEGCAQTQLLPILDSTPQGATDAFGTHDGGELSAITGNVASESVPSEILEVARKPSDQWSKADRKKLDAYRFSQDALATELSQQFATIEKKIAAVAAEITLVMVELDGPRKSHVFVRGDYKVPGESVEPATPAALHAMPAGPLNRLTLAQWLVSPRNPLVARTTVNRWWAELFGQGIVPTLEDLGVKGEPPTHPELLDWLAVELVESGWSMKKLLKTIVTSATYRQSSRVTPELLERDDRNRLLARGPRMRMDAEMIRDNALAISGLLSLQQFGPPIRPYQPDGIWTKVGGVKYDYEVSPGSEQHRRGIYVVLKRGAPYPSFINFDANARLACTVMRSRSNTPLQALTLLNDPVYVSAAKSLAERVQAEQSHASLAEKMDYAFQLCVARRPLVTERETLLQLYHAQLAVGSSQDAWYCVATTLLNLHETITKD
ncbi:MAG: PSD1 and planctomycete cytochrome C domain-containing protein [Pirellulaceae bacterium]